MILLARNSRLLGGCERATVCGAHASCLAIQARFLALQVRSLGRSQLAASHTLGNALLLVHLALRDHRPLRRLLRPGGQHQGCHSHTQEQYFASDLHSVSPLLCVSSLALPTGPLTQELAICCGKKSRNGSG